MSMLGIMFSFMSLYSIVSGIFKTIFSAASNLTGAVSGGALSEAFLGQRVNKEGNPVDMDIGLLVEGYKKSLGVQGEISYQMSLLATL